MTKDKIARLMIFFEVPQEVAVLITPYLKAKSMKEPRDMPKARFRPGIVICSFVHFQPVQHVWDERTYR